MDPGEHFDVTARCKMSQTNEILSTPEVLFNNPPLLEAVTLEEIAARIVGAKNQFPEILARLGEVYVKDGNLIFDVNGLVFQVDGPSVLEMSR